VQGALENEIRNGGRLACGVRHAFFDDPDDEEDDCDEGETENE
jgi:hypothetical protein